MVKNYALSVNYKILYKLPPCFMFLASSISVFTGYPTPQASGVVYCCRNILFFPLETLPYDPYPFPPSSLSYWPLQGKEWKWKLLSHDQLFVTPWAIQSMEFSRPEYWSGQPFPSPGDLPNPGIKPRYPALQMDSLPAEPPGKPKNTGVGSLSLLQCIFLTQELNQGLLHCKRILY